MARPRVFISSTYYDLKHIRSTMENFIDSLGYESILSEKGSIAYNPDIPLDESCYKEAQNSDIFVIIIGGRYGSPTSDTEVINQSDFYERYESVTKMEYESALRKDIPLYILIDKSVKAEYETFKKNRSNKSIKYAHVDSINIFHFIDRIFKQNRNNPVKEFDKHGEIEEWLKIQWAGLFKDLIRTRSNQTEISSLTNQISELSNINTTLKRYMEELISSEPDKGGEIIIEQEEERLKEARLRQKLMENQFYKDLSKYDSHNVDVLIKSFTTAKTLKTLAKKYAVIIGDNDEGKRLYQHWSNFENIQSYIKDIYEILDLPMIKI